MVIAVEFKIALFLFCFFIKIARHIRRVGRVDVFMLPIGETCQGLWGGVVAADGGAEWEWMSKR